MITDEELNHIQKQSLAFRQKLGIKTEPLEDKQEPLEPMQEPLEVKEYDIDLIPPHLRTKDEWAEIITEGTKSKVHFTVTMSTHTNTKFGDLMVYYQNKMPLGRVYKHVVLQLIINEHWDRLRKAGQV